MATYKALLLLTACWSVVIFRAGWAAAGSGDNGMPLNGLSLHGASQQAIGTAAGLSDRATQAMVPSPGVPAEADSPRLIALANSALAATAAKRHQLTYLMRCALPEDIAVYADYGGERFTFQGSMGLAPRWLTEAMTPSEERWVSACLLAHVNYFGKHVRVSMRATPPPSSAFEAAAEEQQTFTIFEGGFFGNLFTPQPVAYTCRGARIRVQAEDPILQDRVCTHETGATTPAGTPITYCRFLLTGGCEDPTSLTVNGTPYAEVIFTYLQPTHRD